MEQTILISQRQRRRRKSVHPHSPTNRKDNSYFLLSASSLVWGLLALTLLKMSTIHATNPRVMNVCASLFRSRSFTRKSLLQCPRNIEQIRSSIPRGGSTLAATPDEDEDNKEVEQPTTMKDSATPEEDDTIQQQQQQHPDVAKLQSYRMRQQVLLQLRACLLSEALVKRGVPLPSLKDAATPESATSRKLVDWDCALSTKEKEIECMFTFDSEWGTKFIAPMDPKEGDQPKDTEWITVVALNRLRRNDATKVETMWHNKYAILDSWFKADSEYSVLQHVGPKGIVLNILLNDNVLTMVIGFSICVLLVVLMPIWAAILNRLLVSGLLWNNWISWGRFVHLGLPFKLMVGQWIIGLVNFAFQRVKGKIKDRLVEWECEILNQSLPLTLGVPTPVHVEEGDAEILAEEEEIMDHLVEQEETVDGDEDNDSDEDDEEEEE
jgi:hypothetical protein